MKKIILCLTLLASMSSFAEGSGDYCKDRLEAITYFSYQEGHQEGMLDLDDELLFSKLGKKGRKIKEENAAVALENMEENLRLLNEKCIIKLK